LYVNIPYSDIIYSFDKELTLKGSYYLEVPVKERGKEQNGFRTDEFKKVFFSWNSTFCVTSLSHFGFGYQWGIPDDFPHENSLISNLSRKYAKRILGEFFGAPMVLVQDSILIEQIDATDILKIVNSNRDSFARISPAHNQIISRIKEDDNPVVILHTIKKIALFIEHFIYLLFQ
jgi:hypothetical protein